MNFPFTIPRTIFDRLSDGAKKILVVQKALYITNGHFFWFCPRFLEKVSETAKQSLCADPNYPFYFPTDKMMRRVTVLS